MAQSKAERLAKVHSDALIEFDDIQSAVWDERSQCLADRRFCNIEGAMWEGIWGDQYENRPRLEVNKIQLAVTRIVNEYRNNRISVMFIPRDGSTGDELTDVCAGLYRADEQDSNANEAYDNAFEEAVTGGFGAWRLRACYEDEEDDENEQQRVKIEPIFDADTTVFFDLDAKRQDKADAKRCYVLTPMTPDAYREKYDDEPDSWDKSIQEYNFDWYGPDVVYVCELYKVEEVTEVVHVFRGLDDEDMKVPAEELEGEEGQQKAEELAATGFREVRQKRMKRRKVHKYILSGGGVLEDEGYIAGTCIPIIPVYGKRRVIDGIERCMGHVRPAKDIQRLINMQMSSLAEISSLSSTEIPIVTPEQMAGHTMMWADQNVKKYPYLLLNNIRDAEGNIQPAGPLGYTKPPQLPPALAALFQITETGMSEILGNQQAGEQLQPNMSGKAVELIQNKLDMQVFLYVDNLSKAMSRCGQVWLSMERDILIEERRRMKTIDEKGEVSSVEMNVPAYDPETGQDFIENDLNSATLDVVAEVGPSSSSRRAAVVRALTGIASITEDPQMRSALLLSTIMNLEGEGMTDLREFARSKAVQMGIVKPTEEEAKQLAEQAANAQPDANTQYLMAAAEEATAGAAQNRAKTVDTIASASLKEAQRIKTLAEAGATQNEAQIASVEALQRVLQPQASPTPSTGMPSTPPPGMS